MSEQTEAQQGEGQEKKGYAPFLRNLGRKIGIPFGDVAKAEKFYVVDSLRPLFDATKKANERIKKAAINIEAIEKISKTVGQLWMASSLHTSKTAIEDERKLLEEGGGTANIRIDVEGETLMIPVPRPQRITINGQVSYDVRYVGKTQEYFDSVTKEVNAFLDRIGEQESFIKKPTGLGKINRVSIGAGKIKLIKQYVKDSVIPTLRGIIQEREDARKKELITDEASASSVLEAIEGEMSKLRKLYPNLEDVYYRHSYKIIRELDAQSQNDAEIIAQLKARDPRWQQLENEGIEMGKDEFGWPLEVAQTDMEYGGERDKKPIKAGDILIDHYLGNPVRNIPQELRLNLIVDCPAIDIANYLFSEWDAIRDDIRDGRYHPLSTSVMDYLMADLKVKDTRHSNTINDLNSGKQAKVIMKLKNRGEVEWNMRPTPFNPAFNFSALAPPIHTGRIYYYDTQEHCVPSKEQMVSSRGAALYIVHKCLSEAKFFEADPSSDGAIEAIEYISSQTDGLDLGPNIEFFGENLQNPFKTMVKQR